MSEQAKEAYSTFLQTPFWRDLSQKKRESIGCCERCGADTGLQCHHKFYRDNWFETRPEDLLVLCENCHREAHSLPSGSSERRWEGRTDESAWGDYQADNPAKSVEPVPVYQNVFNLSLARSRLEISREEFLKQRERIIRETNWIEVGYLVSEAEGIGRRTVWVERR